jgi:hypothetical protein
VDAWFAVVSRRTSDLSWLQRSLLLPVVVSWKMPLNWFSHQRCHFEALKLVPLSEFSNWSCMNVASQCHESTGNGKCNIMLNLLIFIIFSQPTLQKQLAGCSKKYHVEGPRIPFLSKTVVRYL